MPKKRRKGSDIDWSGEILHCTALVGKAFLKLLTWGLNVLITLLLVGGLTGIIVGGAFGLYLLNEIDDSVDDIDFLRVESESNMTTQIYYRDTSSSEEGELVEIESERLSGEENRIWASYDQFPKELVDAVVAIEDKRFWTHPGVDFITTVRCTLEYFLSDGTAGASSITQQLIKNVTGRDDVSIQRKAQEIMCALNLERTMTKTQILELYLNTVYFGHRSNGVAAAAHTYFGKEVKDLTLVECAAIVGITQNPSKWDPYTHPENNRERRQVVLTAMRNQGLISEEEYLEAWHADIVLVGEDQDDDPDDGNNGGDEDLSGIFSWYTECVIDETIALLMEEYGYTQDIAFTKLYTGGLQIVIAMDPELQAILEDYYENEDNFEKVDDSLIQPESSFVLLDPKTSNVLAIVGGRGEKTANRILNYATKTTRPSGSSIKPLTVYGPAIETGLLNYATPIDDTPVNFGTEKVHADGSITYSRPGGYPKNAVNYYAGLVTTHYAIAQSVNTASYKVAMQLGLDYIFDFAKNKLHLDSLIESKTVDGYTVTDKAYAPLALGQQSYGVTNLEMAAAYSIFANGGVYNHPRFVTEIYDSNHNLLIENKQESEIVLSETTASLMTIMMEEVVDAGTASSLTIKKKVDVAAKTGTTQSACDRWLIGYTPYYIGSVWVGYSMPQPLNGFERNPVITAWDGVMTAVHQHIFEKAEETGEPLRTFERAPGLVQATYCRDSGKLVTDVCRLDPRGDRMETGWFTADTVPNEECDCHVKVLYDNKTQAIANPYCPPEDCTWVGLLDVRRSFPVQVKIRDAQYVYWDIASMGIEPGGTEMDPYFILAIPQKTYVGYTSSSTPPFNHACQLHVYVPPVTDIPPDDESEPETTPPPEGGGGGTPGDAQTTLPPLQPAP